MPSWLTVIPMTRVSAKLSIRATSRATLGIAIIGKSPSTRRSGACCTITPAGRLPRRMCAEVRYAGWLRAPCPSTMMTSGSSPSNAATTCFSTSPEQNCGTRASRATPYLPPCMIVVWPVPTRTALTPRVVQRLHQEGGGGALADRAVRAEHGDPRAGDVEDAAGEQLQVLLVARAAYVGDGHAVQQAGGHELGVVVEEVVEPVDDVHAPGDAVEQHDPLGRGEQAVGRCEAADQVVRDLAGVGDGLGQVGEHGDAVGGAVQDLAGVGAGVPAVEDAEDLVLLGVPDQPVGGLAVLLTELAFAVDDGRAPDGEGRGRVRDSR